MTAHRPGQPDEPTTVSERRPDPEHVAYLLYGAILDQRDQFMPEAARVGVLCSSDREHLFVHIGGLSDRFLLGPATNLRFFAWLDPDAVFTGEARQLRFRLLDLARATLPRKPSGELWFATDVWLMTEPFWRSPQFGFHGVTILGKGDLK
ncbi:hypothetical protein ALI22I_23290 [Saccharothrix sp. ALI-22-I]|uniref:hypothetical protein n=1 Tax=Saccharothrix sp. ALI-22-I TaxID=1933778 RepID=UPI00097BE691|nr:hypothetical protein [Saccharothrix sp. ALI-22-I]ONI87349.1 hypothetical protein ALI22I_23290 [Saccharothrix sp. ALI-22-I]